MAKYKITGQNELSGKIRMGGAKNAALKIIPAAIMANSPSTIHDVPRIKDIEKLEEIIVKAGGKIDVDGNTVKIDPTGIKSTKLDDELTMKLRGSIVLAGPMLSRFGEVEFAQPGGCLIGARPIDSHIDVFKQFGVELEERGESYALKGKPKAGEIIMSELSVTATENAIMCAVLSKGTTKVYAGATEPEIHDLVAYLNKMGAKIEADHSHTYTITGVDKLEGVEHTVIPDRVEAGTYLLMGLATNSEITIDNVRPDLLMHVIKRLTDAGAKLNIENNQIKVFKSHTLKAIDIDTRTYPGFPTDLQSQYAVYSTTTNGATRIFETIFESRFGYIEEIKKMGADIEVEGPHIVNIHGPVELNGHEIDANDIRGGAALVMAGLIAKGETTINGIELIERGYERMDEKLKSLGANIEKII